MGTRSNIIAFSPDTGLWRRIYCHWDGHPSHHGPILLSHYSTQPLVDALMALGGLSCLGGSLGSKQNFNDPVENTCRAYHRDRGDDLDIKTSHSLQTLWPSRNSWIEFVYIWDGAKWSYGSLSTPLTHLRELVTDWNVDIDFKGDA